MKTTKNSVVCLSVPSWFYSRRSTDWRMKMRFASSLQDVECVICRNVFFGFAYNLQYLCQRRIVPQWVQWLIVWVCMRVQELVLNRMRPSVLITQGGDVPIPKKSQVIWETLFLGPQLREVNDEFRRGGSDYWIKRMEQFGERVARISVRGSYSVNLIKRMYPEFAHKVVDLGFVHPEYAIMDDEAVMRKQKESRQINILFVGHLARLKGLEPLRDALKLLRARGIENFTLTVVSAFSDGNVDLPNEDWIIHARELSHEKVMQLFQSANIFVMPTFRDSYGLVFHEAMASGCVTCVPDREPQREFVDYGKAGVVIDPYSVNDIADKLSVLIQNRQMREQLALAGVRRYKEKYSQPVIREAWRSVIESVMEEV